MNTQLTISPPRLYAAITIVLIFADALVAGQAPRSVAALNELTYRVGVVHGVTGLAGIVAMMLCRSGRGVAVVVACMLVNGYLALTQMVGVMVQL